MTKKLRLEKFEDFLEMRHSPEFSSSLPYHCLKDCCKEMLDINIDNFISITPEGPKVDKEKIQTAYGLRAAWLISPPTVTDDIFREGR